MRIEGETRTARRMSLTPIIDVVFLLLLFFMLASTFARFAHVEVGVGGRAAAKAGEDTSPLVLLSVKAGGGYAVSGKPVGLADMQAALSEAAPAGRARIVLRPSPEADAEAIIRALEQSQAARLGPVIMMR